MRTAWPTLNARAAGLATHLLTDAQVEVIARSPDLPAFARALSQPRAAAMPEELSERALELCMRRFAARELRTLVRWQPQSPALTLFELDEDRRSVCGIIRGMAGAVGARDRIAGALPTRSLPERALSKLAAASDIPQVGTLLRVWQHPLASAFADDMSTPLSGVARAELAVQLAFARHATAVAQRSGREFRRFTRETIDLLNTITALTIRVHTGEFELAQLFVPGGVCINQHTFAGTAQAPTHTDATDVIAAAFGKTHIARALRTWNGATDLEFGLLRAQVAEWRGRAQRGPLSSAPTLYYLLRLRLELATLQMILWAIVLQLPAPVLLDRLALS